MKSQQKLRLNTKLRFTLFGVLFGAFFPILGVFLNIFTNNLGLSWATITSSFLEEPLLWVIATAPIFLGIFGYFIGDREHKLEEHMHRLDEDIQLGTEKLMRANQDLERQKIFSKPWLITAP